MIQDHHNAVLLDEAVWLHRWGFMPPIVGRSVMSNPLGFVSTPVRALNGFVLDANGKVLANCHSNDVGEVGTLVVSAIVAKALDIAARDMSEFLDQDPDNVGSV